MAKKKPQPYIKIVELPETPCEAYNCKSKSSYEVGIAYGRAMRSSKLAYSFWGNLCKKHLNELREKISLTLLNVDK